MKKWFKKIGCINSSIIGLSFITCIILYQLIFVQIPTYIETCIELKQYEKEQEIQENIELEISDLEGKLNKNTKDFYDFFVDYLASNSTELSEDKEDYTDDEIQFMVLQKYFYENFDKELTSTWSNYEWNIQINIMISLFKDYLSEEDTFNILVLEREKLYAAIEELKLSQDKN